MSNRRLVDSSSRVNIYCVDDLVRLANVLLLLGLVLPRWREQQSAVRSEREAAEERCECLVRV
jgi:hypothetical protein